MPTPAPSIPSPPRLAAWLLRRCVPPHRYDEIAADLDELFADRARTLGRRQARRYYWQDVLSICTRRSLRSQNPPSPLAYDMARGPIMFKNYVTVTLRTLRRQKGYTFINITGLAVGMACCLMILLYVKGELGYDRHHARADRIARLTRETSALSASPIGPAVARELPGVERAVRITGERNIAVERADGTLFETSIYAADSTIFDVFSFTFVRGHAETALRRPDGLVLTETAARTYFGTDDPLGQSLTIHVGEPMPLTVTGVVRDWPSASHFRFELLTSFEPVDQASNRSDNWRTNWLFTYLLLSPNTTPAQIEARLPELFERHTGEAWDHFQVQPLRYIHLHSAHLTYDIAPQGNSTYVYLFSAIAALILLIACINFMNLATARSMKRAREVGIRKVLGAQRGQLVMQFLGESMLLSMLALVLASGLVAWCLPAFRTLSGSELSFTLADSGFLLTAFVLLTLVVGLIAGSYPAFFLAAFRPVATLKSQAEPRAAGGGLRKGLVVFQFAVSIFLIAATLGLHRQLDYVKNARLGFDKEQVVAIDFGDTLPERYETVKRELLQHPNVLRTAATDNIPGDGVSDYMYCPEGWTDDDLPGWDTYFIDPDYLPLFGMEMARGRGFSGNVSSDTTGFLINEAAHEELLARLGDAWTNPVGKTLDFYLPGPERWEVMRSGPIIGVVKDFHYRSLHAPIGPLVLMVVPQAFDYVLLKVGTEDLDGTLAFLEDQWANLGPSRPFNYFFVDDAYEALYRNEARVGSLSGIFAGLAILIACLGLFGLASFMAVQRTKEIGVRKVLGATVPNIIVLLSKDFTTLILVAFAIAVPASYLALDRWLGQFAYHIDMPWLLFLAAGVAALGIALLTVSYQAIRAALADPVDALRYE